MQLGFAQPTNPLIRNRPHNSALTFKHCNLMSKCQINGMRDSKRRRHLKTAWPWLNPYSISDSNHLQTKPRKLETWRNIDDIMITTWCLEAAHHNHTKYLHVMERLVLIRCKSSKSISCTKHLTWKCFQQWGYSLGLITAMGHQSYHQPRASIGF